MPFYDVVNGRSSLPHRLQQWFLTFTNPLNTYVIPQLVSNPNLLSSDKN